MDNSEALLSEPIEMAMLTALGSRKGGGISVALASLSRALGRRDLFAPNVFCSRDNDLENDMGWWGTVNLEAYPTIGPAQLAYAPGIKSRLSELRPALTHAHGLWTMTSWRNLRFANSYGCPYVVSPHGMLDAWAVQHSRWNKKLFGAVIENEHLKRASCISALCLQEAESVRQYGLRNPIAVIPNGVDLPSEDVDLPLPVWLPDDRKALLFLGRIHPKKGLLPLIRSWASVVKDSPKIRDEWFIAIAGWSEGDHRRELDTEIADRGLAEDVRFVGALHAQDKASALRHASAFILPSYSEGLPMGVLEAWAYRLPVAMTAACNLEDGFTANAATELHLDNDRLAQGLLDFLNRPDADLRAMGDAGYDLVREKYSWDHVAEQHEKLYSWLLGSGEEPSFMC
ncbi:glycosyltransferase [Cerasicoccus maritimus]|uniref:glycosyltransferase n=1 Tax=Cerasicoccus maritimus TaxID=490089 RepID=UPI0028528DDB|nr:glycosyltransferase [Cerasicoccus maritimus]